MPSQSQAYIVIGNQTYPLSELTEFGFRAQTTLEVGLRSGGTLLLGGQELPIEFRVRANGDQESNCTFSNFSIADKERVRKYLASMNRINGGNEDLENRTYDELAQGIVSSDTNAGDRAPKDKSAIRSLAMMILLFAMIGLVILASVFLKARSSLTVANSALVGNYIPINARAEGEITEVLVSEGDHIKKGDVLVRLSNPLLLAESLQFAAQVRTGEEKIKSLKGQLSAFEERIKVATRKLDLEKRKIVL